jgi:hypothetical protein
MKIARLTVLALPLIAATACAQPAQEQPASPSSDGTAATLKRRSSHTWIERPWDMRYFILVEDMNGWKASRELAEKKNANPRTRYFNWHAYFEPTTVVPAKPSEFSGSQDFAVVAIEFDKQGFVTTKHSHKGALQGRLNQLLYVTLSSGEEPNARQYDLGTWFTGLGDVSTHWAPGLCSVSQKPDPAQARSDTYLYGRLFKATEFSTTFGCREWAYQLYDDERPYIDVTSYVPKGETFEHGTYVREFIGWARFGDKKPVIGKHEDVWYCLYDCPRGERPGKIADIKAWAARNGWAAPRPPTKAPAFPDPPAKPGTYPK